MLWQWHGKAFLQGFIATLRASGAGAIDIGTGISSHDQLALYQKLGFRITSIVAGFLTTTPNQV